MIVKLMMTIMMIMIRQASERRDPSPKDNTP